MSSFQAEHGFSERPFSALVIGLNREREHLYRRIEERIDWQLANGLLEETRHLLARGYRRDDPGLKGLGYRHAAAYLSGECDQEEMVQALQTRYQTVRQAANDMVQAPGGNSLADDP